jgi:hypothetical protein
MNIHAAKMYPIIFVTGVTAASMLVWLQRHYKNTPEFHSIDKPHSKQLPNAKGAPGTTEGYGRVSAAKTGLMDDDRAFQGIFPAKRMTEAMSGVLPAKQPDHPSVDKQRGEGK